ncbi:glycosyltransferase [Marinobacter sp.]|uniref:glycosyltransferase n=1 Tax=Marinobacter sp. TaxID=50741 RepID=UPI0035C7255B
MRVLIVYSGSGRGLKKDSQILKAAVESHGHECAILQLAPLRQWRRNLEKRFFALLQRLTSERFRRLYFRTLVRFSKLLKATSPEDLVVHLENIQPTQLWKGQHHWLIPNQEWFIESRLPYLAEVDKVLGKTRHAAEIFEKLHSSTEFLGFTGDMAGHGMQQEQKNYGLALHVAGTSQLKGTQSVLNCWQRHPEWPKLVVVSEQAPELPAHLPNVEIRKNIKEEELSSLWGKAGFAIQPSEVEGYGQVLAEALANGCVTITTDAPPMNELVSPTFGFLARPTATQKFRLGTRFRVADADLETVVAGALTEPLDMLGKRAELAREWSTTNHSNFLRRLGNFLNEQARQPSLLSETMRPEKHH